MRLTTIPLFRPVELGQLPLATFLARRTDGIASHQERTSLIPRIQTFSTLRRQPYPCRFAKSFSREAHSWLSGRLSNLGEGAQETGADHTSIQPAAHQQPVSPSFLAHRCCSVPPSRRTVSKRARDQPRSFLPSIPLSHSLSPILRNGPLYALLQKRPALLRTPFRSRSLEQRGFALCISKKRTVHFGHRRRQAYWITDRAWLAPPNRQPYSTADYPRSSSYRYAVSLSLYVHSVCTRSSHPPA